jgi:uridylate kinase
MTRAVTETVAQSEPTDTDITRTGVSVDDARRTVSAAAPAPSVGGRRSTRRVVLKLSGEVFGGGAVGVDPDVVQSLARQIATVVRRGTQIALVVGGGNFFRGAELQRRGMDRPRADYMGMLGTVMNCLALQDFLEKEGIDTRVQTAISMAQVAEPYIPRRAIRHLEKGRVVIFGAGAGMPYFSTDTVAAQRALEIHADIVLMSKNGVDGVYTADPRTDPEARKLDTITFDEAIRRGLKVVDAAAFSLCMENRLPMLVFGAEGEDTISRAVAGEEKIGTLITAAAADPGVAQTGHDGGDGTDGGDSGADSSGGSG